MLEFTPFIQPCVGKREVSAFKVSPLQPMPTGEARAFSSIAVKSQGGCKDRIRSPITRSSCCAGLAAILHPLCQLHNQEPAAESDGNTETHCSSAMGDRLTAGDLGKMLLGSCLGQATAINHSTTAAEEAAAGFQGHIGQAPVGEAGRARTRSRGAGEAAGRMFARHLHYGPSRPPLRTLNINYI